MSTLRLRKKPLLDVVQRLDAFEKVQETVREEKSVSGGLLFLVCAVLVVWLVISEFIYYTSTHFDYRFTVDTEYDKKLHIEIDIVVSMPCHTIGADVMDATDQPLMLLENQLKMDPVDFELSDAKRQYWDSIRDLKRKQKPGQSGLENLLFVTSIDTGEDNLEPSKEEQPDEEDDGSDILVIELGIDGSQQRIRFGDNARHSRKKACRIHGFIQVNKVNGNLHVTPGKSLPIGGGGHLHISQFGGPSYNFSHRIQKLAFGRPVNVVSRCDFINYASPAEKTCATGLMNPLDGVEEISDDPFQMYQYYAQVVPTKVHSRAFPPVDTCQYAVSKRHRLIDHSRGSHGMPGIFIKYDLNPIKVDVYETHRSYLEFAVRLCAIIGGVFATSGVINLLLGGLCGLAFGRRHRKIASRSNSHMKESFANGADTSATVRSSPLLQRPSDRAYGQAFVT